ncbi:MAG: GAF domain-containing protein [Pseudonocardiales bacterium]
MKSVSSHGHRPYQPPTKSALAGADLRRVADEQAALRRVAQLVARGAGQGTVLDAIAAEAFELFDVDFTALLRYERDGAAAIIAVHNAPPGLAVGDHAPHIHDGLVLQVFRSGRPARVEAYADVPGREVARMHELGVTAGAAAPILVEARLWGVIAAMTRSGTVATNLEHRLADFAEIAATAVAGTQARDDLRGLADEQAALRRVAELVARGAALEEVFCAVAVEASALLADLAAALLRYDSDGWATIVAACNSPAPLGLRVPSTAGTATGEVLRTGRPTRVDSFTGTSLADIAEELGVGAGVAVPVTVESRVWGALTTSTSGTPLPVETEQRLTQFAGLAAAAIANAENKAQLTASRTRVVATADETRRRLQRDLHDGAQQRLVHTIITLKLARDAVAKGQSAADLVVEALYHAERANAELRDLVQGILPASLIQGGLRIALESLIEDIAIPVSLQMTAPRLRAETETTAYFVVAEALTNVVKHACATHAQVTVGVDGGMLRVEVRDDGAGGANPAFGTGLTGLGDRVDAADGILTITSAPGSGTRLHASFPVARSAAADNTSQRSRADRFAGHDG